ncbi:hypothetical protein Pmani_011648 [Petrolisthes manimaculis]|uniref:PHD-type domain-containing protein n=2 Tax=Petrolisthes manimaculis TaxID=1843537 RepID=A0AAE1NY98_9EUCA|nr:hypothetical protein Pmani_030239 [Petrolisthes manimaculis]KAK4302013.1 hypothetical protein Pmani_025875 [Petrolisthes manimaculis]KAK4308089.1 hypothetical protein Pmani_020202 [Petrolisthes manimaculis]KAK4315788.1 hypothetical protein Pmani_012996 [Petrolisthes manimaculis]KAK4316658.1 hypothetical protein Pmani_012199 [Petrolisthes manimaculis]
MANNRPELRSADRKGKKRCIECSYFAVLNENQVCKSCESSNESAKCGDCGVRVGDADNGVQCEFCKLWYHAGCCKVSIKTYKTLKDEPSLPWSCKTCKSKISRNLAEVERLREEIFNLKKELRELNRHNNWVKQQAEDNEAKWEDRGRIMAEQAADKMMERMREKEDKEKRRNNLIMFNVPESDKEETRDRVKEDTEICEHIFVQKLEVENFKIEKVVRLGKKANGRIRPTLVRVEDEETKWRLISRGKMLKNDAEEKMKKIGMSPDLTKTEQQENKRLRNILEEKKRGGGRWKIQRGRIINLDVPYWQQTNYGQKPNYHSVHIRAQMQKRNESDIDTERPNTTVKPTRNAEPGREDPNLEAELGLSGNVEEQQVTKETKNEEAEEERNEATEDENQNENKEEEVQEDQGN